MITDKQGNKLHGATTETAELFDQAVETFSLYRGDPIAPLDKAIEVAPKFAMAQVMKAHLLALATEPEATRNADAIIKNLKTMRLTEREASHVAALERVLDGNWTDAAVALDRHNISYPQDLLAIQSGHLIDFYRANGRNLRDRLARVLPKWSTDLPGYSILLGMYAFGLEENGDYTRAEETGRRAVELQPLDCWAHHAVTHVMEMQGRAEDGIGWMITREPYWAQDDNFFKVHNWWHRCLFHLDLGQIDQVLALYDTRVREGRSTVALNLIDASALLWRLHLAGIDVGDRWQEIATSWEQHTKSSDYPFNDWHAAMSCLGAGRDSDLDNILVALQKTRSGKTEAAEWTQRNGLPLIEGFIAFWRGNYSSAAERLYSARYIANSFGGSHAQRDIIDMTLSEAAIRGGLGDLAEALANERLALKSHSDINRSLLSRSQNSSASNARMAA
jgi:tetratricopeptide (TPR) repeat protein